MPQLGRFVLDAACRHAQPWLTRLGLDRCPVVSVHLSTVQLGEDAVIDAVQSALLAHNLPARLLRLEVTETSVMRDPSVAAERLTNLRAMGCSIVLDDFGTADLVRTPAIFMTRQPGRPAGSSPRPAGPRKDRPATRQVPGRLVP